MAYSEKAITLSEYHKNLEQKARAINYKADFLQLKREFSSSIENYLESIKIKEKLYGPYNRGNVVSYTNLAGAYAQLNYLDKSIEYQERAIAVNKKLSPENQSTNTIAYSNLGVYYTEFGEPQKAVEYHKEALLLLEKEFGNDYPLFPVFSKNFGDTYYDIQDYTNAEKQYKASVNFIIEKYGKDDSDLGESYINLALVAKKRIDFDLAIQYLKKAIKVLPENNFLKTQAQLELVDALISDEKYSAANEYLNIVSKKLPKKELSELNIDQIKDRKQFISTKISYFKVLNSITKGYTDSLTHYYENAFILDNYSVKQYTTESSKEFELSKVFPVYENYIEHIIDFRYQYSRRVYI